MVLAEWRGKASAAMETAKEGYQNRHTEKKCFTFKVSGHAGMGAVDPLFEPDIGRLKSGPT
jgi:hypothetical protein